MKKIEAVYVDNSKTFTKFVPVYIVIDNDEEEKNYKIRIGRTIITSEKAKSFKIDVFGLKKSVYLTIKTSAKEFNFKDINYEDVAQLKVFEKEQKQRKRKVTKKVVKDLDEKAKPNTDIKNLANPNLKIVETEITETKVEKPLIELIKFLPRK